MHDEIKDNVKWLSKMTDNVIKHASKGELKLTITLLDVAVHMAGLAVENDHSLRPVLDELMQLQGKANAELKLRDQVVM